jgi:hypothetical protein
MGLLAIVRSLPEALKISVQGTSAEFSDTVTDFLVGDLFFLVPHQRKISSEQLHDIARQNRQ